MKYFGAHHQHCWGNISLVSFVRATASRKDHFPSRQRKKLTQWRKYVTWYAVHIRAVQQIYRMDNFLTLQKPQCKHYIGLIHRSFHHLPKILTQGWKFCVIRKATLSVWNVKYHLTFSKTRKQSLGKQSGEMQEACIQHESFLFPFN